MNPATGFALASLLTMAVPPLLAAAPWWLGRPRHGVLRAVLAIGTAWTLSVILTSAVHNPAGVAAAHARGEHFPEARYDNNTVAVQLMCGWIGPAIAVLFARVVARCRDAWRRRRALATAAAMHGTSS